MENAKYCDFRWEEIYSEANWSNTSYLQDITMQNLPNIAIKCQERCIFNG